MSKKEGELLTYIKFLPKSDTFLNSLEILSHSFENSSEEGMVISVISYSYVHMIYAN